LEVVLRFFATQKRALFVSLTLLFGVAACQVLLDDETTYCSTNADCESRFGGGTSCVDGLCRSSSSSEASTTDVQGSDAQDSTTPPECTTNAECIEKYTLEGPLDAGVDDAGNPLTLDGGFTADGKVAAVCVKQSGKCARLVTPECRDFIGDPTNNDAIVLGTFLSVSGSLAASNVPRQRSAILAAEEFNSSSAGGGIPGPDGTPIRPLVVLNCDPSTNNDTQSPMRAAAHLIEDLRVPAFVGPNVAQEFVDINNEYAAKDRAEATVMISPTVPILAATGFNDRNLTWRTVPSDGQRTKLLIDQVNAVENQLKTERGGRKLKLGILYRDEALGQSALDSVSATLTINGKSLSSTENADYVKIAKYANQNDVTGMNKVASEWADFAPDIVLVSTQEIVVNFVLPLEQGLNAKGIVDRPYYIGNDIAKTPAWGQQFSQPGVADLQRRVRGIGTTPDGQSRPLFDAFNLAYGNRFGTPPPTTAGMGPAYDAMYAIGYALAATRNEFPPTGLTVAKGLQRLASGTNVNVGASNITAGYQALNGPGGTVNVRGTFGLLSFTEKGDIAGGTLDVWCISSASKNPIISSGRTMDVGSQSISGTYVPCP
jgi:ABC-type branched-subunit amino acid transport system substrate-binding protein